MSSYKIYVYKIWWDGKNDFYVGSTKLCLSARMASHRSIGKNNRSSLELYKKMNDNNYGYNFNYILLDSKYVSSVDEKLKLEQRYIDKLKPNLAPRNIYNNNNNNNKKQIPCGKIDIRKEIMAMRVKKESKSINIQ